MKHTLLRLTTLLALTVMACVGISPVLAAYTDNGDGTVTDTTTGLMWDKCSWGQTEACWGGSASTHTWQEALTLVLTANSINYMGYNDWRLPNIKELMSIVEINTINTAIDTTAFPHRTLDEYWSSTPDTLNLGNAWRVEFSHGVPYQAPISNRHGVRLVRSGQPFASFDAIPPVVMSPAAPTLVRVVPGNDSMTLVFSPPSWDGGAPVTGYTATCTEGGVTRTQSGDGSPLVVTGLTKGGRYTCSVHATNSAGSSAESTAIVRVARRPSLVPLLSTILN